MIIHLFNSSSVSGPEKLVMAALAEIPDRFQVLNLLESRIDRLSEKDPVENYARSLNLPYSAVTVRRRWDRSAIEDLARLLGERQPELVHAHGPKASLYLLRATRRQNPRVFPIVSTHHGIRGLPDWKTRLYEWIYRYYFLQSYDRVIAVSSEDYQIFLRSGIDSGHLRLQLNGADARRVPAAERLAISHRVRSQWLPDEPERDGLFLFGVVARLSKEKDHARILRVLASLQHIASTQPWICLMFGMGELDSKLRRQTIELGLQQRVRWMGYRHGVADELAGFDLLLSLSTAEGLPINLIEAGWAGTPVMCTPVGGIKELIPDQSYGCWVKPDEPASITAGCLQRLISPDGKLQLRTIGQRFQERVTTEFTRDRWLQRLAEISSELNVKFSDPSAGGDPVSFEDKETGPAVRDGRRTA